MDQTLRLAYSPDADDAFMFRAALEGLIDTDGLRFVAVTADTQRLNDMADRGDVDVSAVSVAAWPMLAHRFLLLPHGGSVGRGYGPVIVAGRERSLDSLQGMTIATPGEGTTAHMIARLALRDPMFKTIPITPYEAIFDALANGDVDAGIIIHEGRLTYEQHGLWCVVDLGVWWNDRTGLPLPLGANVIRRDLGDEVIRRASSVLRRSIRWALDHRDEMIAYLIGHVHRPEEVAQRDLLDQYLAMYANEETHGYSADTLAAFDALFDLAYREGLLRTPVAAEFAGAA